MLEALSTQYGSNRDSKSGRRRERDEGRERSRSRKSSSSKRKSQSRSFHREVQTNLPVRSGDQTSFHVPQVAVMPKQYSGSSSSKQSHDRRPSKCPIVTSDPSSPTAAPEASTAKKLAKFKVSFPKICFEGLSSSPLFIQSQGMLRQVLSHASTTFLCNMNHSST